MLEIDLKIITSGHQTQDIEVKTYISASTLGESSTSGARAAHSEHTPTVPTYSEPATFTVIECRPSLFATLCQDGQIILLWLLYFCTGFARFSELSSFPGRCLTWFDLTNINKNVFKSVQPLSLNIISCLLHIRRFVDDISKIIYLFILGSRSVNAL